MNLAVTKTGNFELIKVKKLPLFCNREVSIVVIEMCVTLFTETETVRGKAVMIVFGSIIFRGIAEITRNIRSM
jgi:hypothetical protein